MGKSIGALFSVFFASVSAGWTDTIPLALPAPLPQWEVELQTLPDLTLANFKVDHAQHAVADVSAPRHQVDEQADLSAFGFSCTEQMLVTPLPDARITVKVIAPCRPDQVVRLSHASIDFDVTLSMVGEVEVVVPTVSNHGEIDSIFDDYSVITELVVMPETEGYARVALVWEDADLPQLAARAPRHIETDVITLGDGSGRVAQVLSHRLDPDARPGVIRLSMAETVTDQNCARQRSGHVVQYIPGRPVTKYDLMMGAAGCDRVGSNRELKNVLPDLKLASN